MPIFLKNLIEGHVKSIKDVQSILPQIVAGIQKVYDEWNQDENGEDPELGIGGICQNIAEEISDILSHHGFESMTVDNGGMGEQHVWAVVNVKEGVFSVDVPFNVYERGGGYSWKKIPGVVFDKNDIIIYKTKTTWEDLQDSYY